MVLKQSGKLKRKPQGEASGHGKQALLAGWRASRGIRGFSSLGKITGLTFQLA